MTIANNIGAAEPSRQFAPVIQFFLGVPRSSTYIEQHMIHDEEPDVLRHARQRINSLFSMGLEDHEIGRHIEIDLINGLRDLDIEINHTLVQTDNKRHNMHVTVTLFDEPTDDELQAMLTTLCEKGRKYHEYM